MQSQLVMTCVVCAQEASGDAAFCSRCGSRLSARGVGDDRVTPLPVPASGLASLLTGLDAPAVATDRPFDNQDPNADRLGHQEWEVTRRSPRRGTYVLVALALVLVAAIAALLVHGMSGPAATVIPTGSTPGSGASGAAGAGTAKAPGSSAPSAIAGSLDADAGAQAPSTSPAGRDAAGDPTSYAASLMLDGDPETTWRMDGDGTGTTLTFTLDHARSVKTLGLINGYAKVDPASGADRYTQERRITQVTWTLDGHSYPQTLTDGDRSMQTIPVGPVTASTITLHLDATASPGQAAFDKTAISDVLLGG